MLETGKLPYFVILLSVIFIAIRATYTEGQFSFASYYGDHMVLQRGPQRANIWGYSPKIGDHLTVTVNGQSVSTTVVHGAVHTGGIWTVKLPAITQHGPYVIKAQSSAGVITLNDILFGDVWICSGQSNMQFTVGMGYNASAEIEDADNYPNIRVMAVGLKPSPERQTDLLEILQKWSVASRASIGGPDWGYFSAMCWFYGKYTHRHRGYPIGLISSTWSGSSIEPWTSPEGLRACGVNVYDPIIMATPKPGELYVPSEPTVLWNSMMSPLTKMTIYGAIWYQGSGNAGNPAPYKCYFPAMIQDWREKFHNGSYGETEEIFPFGFVQLFPYNLNDTIGGFPAIRWAQTAGFGYVPNSLMTRVFMAVPIDFPDYDSPFGAIHPRNKKDVSLRLGLAGKAVAYNVSGIHYQGPIPTMVSVNPTKETLTIEFDNRRTPIEVRGSHGFEVCCSFGTTSCNPNDEEWRLTPIVDQRHSAVDVLYGDNCGLGARVLGIRYAWRESPCPRNACAIYSIENGLPAPPYLSLGRYA